MPPLFSAPEDARLLEATGMPLGLFLEAAYTAETVLLPPGGALLLLPTDFPIRSLGKMPKPVCEMLLLVIRAKRWSFLKSLVDPNFNEDDITILLMTCNPDIASPGSLG